MPYSALSDRKLLARSASGDQQAFARLYARNSRRLTAFLYERCGRDAVLAQDLLQQVFLQLIESKAFAKTSSGPPNLAALLYSIASNVLKNSYRANTRRRKHLDAYQHLPDAIDEGDQPDKLNTEQLELGLQTLSDKHREVVELRFKDGLSIQEISELLDCSPGTIKSRLHYGLQKLSSAVQPKMPQS